MNSKHEKIGLFGTIALVVSGMLGCGILILPQGLAKFGTWGFIGCALASYMAYCIFKSFVHLRKYCIENNISSEPTTIDFLKILYSDTVAFLLVFGHFIALTASCSTVALALAHYLLILLPENFCLSLKVIASLSLLIVFGINIISTKLADYFNQILNVVKVFFFALIGVVGLFYFRNYSVDFLNGVRSASSMFYSAALSMFAFMGIEFAVFASSNIENPDKNVSKGTVIGLIITTLVILGVYFSCAFVLSDLANCNTPVATTAFVLFGKWGKMVFALIPILSCLSCLNGCMVVQGNTSSSLSEKGWLFKVLSKKTNTGFAYLGALTSIIISNIWIFSSVLNIELIQIMAVCFVALVYLSIGFVDFYINGLNIMSLSAVLSSFIMLCKINCNILVIMVVMYAFAYLIKIFVAKENKI